MDTTFHHVTRGCQIAQLASSTHYILASDCSTLLICNDSSVCPHKVAAYCRAVTIWIRKTFQPSTGYKKHSDTQTQKVKPIPSGPATTHKPKSSFKTPTILESANNNKLYEMHAILDYFSLRTIQAHY